MRSVQFWEIGMAEDGIDHSVVIRGIVDIIFRGVMLPHRGPLKAVTVEEPNRSYTFGYTPKIDAKYSSAEQKGWFTSPLLLVHQARAFHTTTSDQTNCTKLQDKVLSSTLACCTWVGPTQLCFS